MNAHNKKVQERGMYGAPEGQRPCKTWLVDRLSTDV